MNRLHLSSVFAGLTAKMQKPQAEAFRFYARRVGRRKLVKKKQTNKQARTDAEREKRKLLAKDDKAFSFGRALLLKVEACYTCGLRAFAPGREEIFNTLIKSRLRIST